MLVPFAWSPFKPTQMWRYLCLHLLLQPLLLLLYFQVHAMVCVLYEDARAMAPNGQPALVFPHRQHQKDTQTPQDTTPCDQQQQQQLPSDQALLQLQQQQLSELQTLREQLTAQSEELRLQGIHARSGGSSSGFGPLPVL